MNTLKVSAYLLLSLSLISCQKDFENHASRITIAASLDCQDTKVTLEKMEGSKDMASKWQGFEYLKVFLKEDGVYNDTSPDPIKISDVNASGTGANFTCDPPNEWGIHEKYELKCFTTTCRPTVAENKIYFNASLVREGLQTFVFPVYTEGVTDGKGYMSATFHHYYTYELLHVTNLSPDPISFSLSGFETEKAWYMTKGSLCLETGEFIVEAASTQNPVSESSAIQIAPGGKEIVVSAYIPNGYKIQNATMVAKVNGNSVKTANRISSDAQLSRGRAYHMYASWDGFRLQFQDGTVAKRISLGESSLTIEVGTNNRAVYLNGSDDGYNVSSSSEAVATAFASGNILYVNGIGAGECDITVTGNSGQEPGVLHVTVTGGDTHKVEYVDLGLPSGIKWATCNVGASSPEEFGDYYAWGEVETKDIYSWGTYKWCNGSKTSMTKYCTSSSFGTIDNTTVLEPEDDAAHVKLGGNWRMPTDDEVAELWQKCTWTWTSVNGVNGIKITSKVNGNGIFIPAAGSRCESELLYSGRDGYCISSSLFKDTPSHAYGITFKSSNIYETSFSRYAGRPVRPVYDEGTSGQADISVSPEEVEFGTVYPGERATASFTITNSGTAAASVSVSTPSTPVASDVSGEITINPGGGSKTVTLIFTPREKGSYGGKIQVSSGGKDINVLYAGNCIERDEDSGDLFLSTNSVIFGNTWPGHTAYGGLVVSNGGTNASNVSVSGMDWTFSLQAGQQTFAIEPGASVSVLVMFKPSSEGSYAGQLSISSGNSNLTVKLAGISDKSKPEETGSASGGGSGYGDSDGGIGGSGSGYGEGSGGVGGTGNGYEEGGSGGGVSGSGSGYSD